MESNPLQFALEARGGPFHHCPRRDCLRALAILYGRLFAEEPVAGSEFDHRVLDALTKLINELEKPK